jgi:hypothetical protein
LRAELEVRKGLLAVGVGLILGCALVYLTSLVGYSPRSVGGFVEWGVPFPWHNVSDGPTSGGLTIGPYRFVNLFNLGLDLALWCTLAVIAVYVLFPVIVVSIRLKSMNVGIL